MEQQRKNLSYRLIESDDDEPRPKSSSTLTQRITKVEKRSKHHNIR